MGKHRKRAGPTFVALYDYVLNSPGYRSLSVTARAALVEVVSLYHGNNNGRLQASTRWLGERLNCSKSTAARALVELEDGGLIETVRFGVFNRHNRTAAEYRLTFHRCDVSHHLPSKAFLKPRHGPTGDAHGPTYGTVASKTASTVPPMGPSGSF